MAGFINGLLARKFDDIAVIPTFVLTPLTYLGGVFYSLSLLPPFWETALRLNPIVYMLSAFRYGILNDRLDPALIDINMGVAFVVIVLSIIGLFSAALWMLNRGSDCKPERAIPYSTHTECNARINSLLLPDVPLLPHGP